MPKKKLSLGVEPEAWEQEQYFKWVYTSQVRIPELELCNGSLNGVYLTPKQKASVKLQGLRRGIPDIDLPVRKGPYSGLKIELKRVKGGRVDPEQRRIHALLTDQGYLVLVCRGWVEAVEATCRYLNVDPGHSFKKSIA